MMVEVHMKRKRGDTSMTHYNSGVTSHLFLLYLKLNLVIALKRVLKPSDCGHTSCKLCVCVCVVTVNTTGTSTPLPTTTEWLTDLSDIVSKFSLRTAELPEDDMCYIVPGRPQTIKECEFNTETQTFIVIHGWTVRHAELVISVCVCVCGCSVCSYLWTVNISLALKLCCGDITTPSSWKTLKDTWLKHKQSTHLLL